MHGTDISPAPPPDGGSEDIQHIGQLYALIRLSRDIIKVKDFARALGMSESLLSRFESGEIRTTRYFEKLVRALAQDRVGDMLVTTPLKEDEVALLLDLYAQNRTEVKHRALSEQLDEIYLADILPENIRTKTQKQKYLPIVQALEQQAAPAFIADALWFIHAINGAALRLFGIDPGSTHGLAYVKRWEAWHVMASKFTNPSPVREAHVEPNRYFPPVVDAFCRDIYPFLFTPHVRGLLRRLHAMSRQNRLGFARMWEPSVRLKSFLEEEESLYRGIIYQGRQIQAAASQRVEWTVYPHRKYPVLYWMGVWEPFDGPAEEAFAHLQSFPDSHAIYYAADPKHLGDFHISRLA